MTKVLETEKNNEDTTGQGPLLQMTNMKIVAYKNKFSKCVTDHIARSFLPSNLKDGLGEF